MKEFYIPNWEVIQDTACPDNKEGTCGYVGAFFLLSHWLDRGRKQLREANRIHQELRAYGKHNSTWARSIRNVMREYCKDHGIEAGIHYRLLGFGIRRQLKKGNPVIIFGMFPRDPAHKTGKNRYIFHAVTVYGWDGRHFICHYGWKGYEKTVLSGGVIGSYAFVNYMKCEKNGE